MAYYAYIGCRTTKERGARGKGIKLFEITESGTWQMKQLVEKLVNPSFLCFDETGENLYAVHGDYSEISAFEINKENGELVYINTVSTQGRNPVHLSVDSSNQWIFVANLQTGTVAVIARNIDGSLADCKALYTISGLSEGTISHPHQVIQDGTRDYLLVSCQGRKEGFGQVVVFKIDHDNGQLKQTCIVRSREIAEPRHMVFHPNNKFCYGVNEKDYSVTSYMFDESNGQLIPQQILPTLPSTYTGDGWASGIVIDNTGTCVIASNRKHNSVTSFKIDQDSGYLTYADCAETGGDQPRFIVVNPYNNRIIVANELSDIITEFEIDCATGSLTKVNQTVETESPVCVVFS